MATLSESQAAVAAITITLGSLANSTSGVGRQGTLIDNTSNLYIGAYISASIKMGTSPTANALVYLYLIRDNNDSTAIRDDGAGTTDAGITIINAPLIGTLLNPNSTTGNVLKGVFYVPNLAAKWTVAVVNSSGVALDSTNGNHVISYIGVKQTIA